MYQQVLIVAKPHSLENKGQNTKVKKSEHYGQ